MFASPQIVSHLLMSQQSLASLHFQHGGKACLQNAQDLQQKKNRQKDRQESTQNQNVGHWIWVGHVRWNMKTPKISKGSKQHQLKFWRLRSGAVSYGFMGLNCFEEFRGSARPCTSWVVRMLCRNWSCSSKPKVAQPVTTNVQLPVLLQLDSVVWRLAACKACVFATELMPRTSSCAWAKVCICILQVPRHFKHHKSSQNITNHHNTNEMSICWCVHAYATVSKQCKRCKQMEREKTAAYCISGRGSACIFLLCF